MTSQPQAAALTLGTLVEAFAPDPLVLVAGRLIIGGVGAAAVGHRVVHGGPDHAEEAMIARHTEAMI